MSHKLTCIAMASMLSNMVKQLNGHENHLFVHAAAATDKAMVDKLHDLASRYEDLTVDLEALAIDIKKAVA